MMNQGHLVVKVEGLMMTLTLDLEGQQLALHTQRSKVKSEVTLNNLRKDKR